MSELDALALGPGLTLQSRNAGNAVDQLKHRLLVELLAEASDRPPVLVDTHAGAGVYHQPPRAQEMRHRLARLQVGGEHPYDCALDAYFESQVTSLPGSPWFALRYAAQLRALRFCEFHPEHAARLRGLATIMKGEEKASVFEGDYRRHLDALLAGPGPFVLHLDPFGVTTEDRGPAGWLGAQDLRGMGERLQGESFSALVFFGHAEDEADLEERRDMVTEALRGANSRVYTRSEGDATYAVLSLASRA